MRLLTLVRRFSQAALGIGSSHWLSGTSHLGCVMEDRKEASRTITLVILWGWLSVLEL